MGKQAAAVMASQASNLRLALTHLRGDRYTPPYGLELVEKVAEALEDAATEELKAGKRWWREEQARQASRRAQEQADVRARMAAGRRA